MERCATKIVPKSERGASSNLGSTIAPATTMAAMTLDRTIIHGRISRTPNPAADAVTFGRHRVQSMVRRFDLIFSYMLVTASASIARALVQLSRSPTVRLKIRWPDVLIGSRQK